MGGGKRILSLCCAILLAIFTASRSEAVVFFSTGDPNFNTTAPEGALTNSGWQWQGHWSFFLGTPIASNYFITARHVSGSTNDTFIFEGKSYSPAAAYHHPVADLTVWRVDDEFTNFAELYQGSDEVGKPLVVVGRGLQRGAEIRLNGELRGWHWGPADGRMRWGENVVAAITDQQGNPIIASNRVECLRAIFRTNAGPNEAHLSNSDSGGAVFIREDGRWKLAGINFSVDGGYNTNDAGKGFEATLFDERGLYKGSERRWEYQYGMEIQPGGFYATRISAYRGWIERIIKYGHSNETVSVEAAGGLEGPFEGLSEAEVDPASLTIRFPAPPDSRFYRLRALQPVRITSITNAPGTLVLGFE